MDNALARLDLDSVRAYAGEHDGHDVECPRCTVATLLAELGRLDKMLTRCMEARDRVCAERDRLREFVRRFVASAGYDDEDLLDALVVMWDDALALLDDRTETT